MSKDSISPCLWFDGLAEEAANFYVSVFKNSRVTDVARWGDGGSFPKGTAMMVSFELDGRPFNALNGGPQFKFSEAVSMIAHCDSQEEIDHYWERLTADGGKPVQCGWLTDKYGLSWQIVPRVIAELMRSKEPGRSGRVMAALMKMQKLNIAELQAAYDA